MAFVTRNDISDIPLQLTSVSYSYGARKALDDVTFSVEPGRFGVLLGLNGAGKTTLFSLISRLFVTPKGSINIFGNNINKSPSNALRRIGIVFQARTLDLDLTVRQNLLYHASLHGIGRKPAERKIEELLESIDMRERLHEKARSLSGGQIRRVEIIRSLLHDPDLLLLDEATVGLDIKSRAGILSYIRGLVQMKGTSVLWSTHLVDEIEATDQVVVLNKGRLIANGTAEKIIADRNATNIGEAFSALTHQNEQPPSEKLQ